MHGHRVGQNAINRDTGLLAPKLFDPVTSNQFQKIYAGNESYTYNTPFGSLNHLCEVFQ